MIIMLPESLITTFLPFLAPPQRARGVMKYNFESTMAPLPTIPFGSEEMR